MQPVRFLNMEGVKKKLETYCTIYKCTNVWNTNDNIWRKMSRLFWIFSGTLDGTLLELYLTTRPFIQDDSLLLKIYISNVTESGSQQKFELPVYVQYKKFYNMYFWFSIFENLPIIQIGSILTKIRLNADTI